MKRFLNKYIRVWGKDYSVTGICVNVTDTHIRMLRDIGDGSCSIETLKIETLAIENIAILEE